MASESGVTTSSAHITSILLPTARKVSIGPLRHQCLSCLLLRRRRVNQDKQVASTTTKPSVPYVLTVFCGVSAAQRSLAIPHISSFLRRGLGSAPSASSFRRSHCLQLSALSANFVSLISSFEHVRVIPTCASLSPSSHDAIQLNIDGSVRLLLQLSLKI